MVFDNGHVLIEIPGRNGRSESSTYTGDTGQYKYTDMEFLCKAVESQDANEDYNGSINGELLRISHLTGVNLGPHILIF